MVIGQNKSGAAYKLRLPKREVSGSTDRVIG
jgi:hypothetical protein